jgi:hypothetical protein
MSRVAIEGWGPVKLINGGLRVQMLQASYNRRRIGDKQPYQSDRFRYHGVHADDHKAGLSGAHAHG